MAGVIAAYTKEEQGYYPTIQDIQSFGEFDDARKWCVANTRDGVTGDWMIVEEGSFRFLESASDGKFKHVEPGGR